MAAAFCAWQGGTRLSAMVVRSLVGVGMAVSFTVMGYQALTTEVPAGVFRRKMVFRQLQDVFKAFERYAQNIANDNYAAGQAGLNDVAVMVLAELGKTELAQEFAKVRNDFVARGAAAPRLRERPSREEWAQRQAEAQAQKAAVPAKKPRRRPSRH